MFHTGTWKECEEKGAEETKQHGELTAVPFPISLHHWRGGNREIVSEVKPGKNEEMGRSIFLDLFLLLITQL